jgi:hypothetical protein
MARRRRLLVLLVAAAVLLVPSAPASAAGFVARLRAPTHHPKAGALWPITVTARTRSGRSLRATASYQFLFQGHVRAHAYPSPRANPRSTCSKAGTCRHAPWPFRGTMRDGTFIWPARAAGILLTFRVVVAVRGRGHVNLDYPVRVRR